ncbi:hypothetical protein PQR37_40410 [Paraburkholderia nemoris]|nr:MULTISPECIES: hypothetical protein [Paraburkholderia]MBK3778886.1 hypothetical protein [Paraburkholderia aspalathi]
MTAKNIIAKNEIKAAAANRNFKRMSETCRDTRLKPAANTRPDYFII